MVKEFQEFKKLKEVNEYQEYSPRKRSVVALTHGQAAPVTHSEFRLTSRTRTTSLNSLKSSLSLFVIDKRYTPNLLKMPGYSVAFDLGMD
jgi:hypothetical protein